MLNQKFLGSELPLRQVKTFLQNIPHLDKHGLFLVGGHRQGKTFMANLIADSLLERRMPHKIDLGSWQYGREPCYNADCMVEHGKVLITASSVTSEDWLLGQVAKATRECSNAVVIIDDLGVGNAATVAYCVNAVQKLLDAPTAVPYNTPDGQKHELSFTGLVIITSNDYDFQTERDLLELCYSTHHLTENVDWRTLKQAETCTVPLANSIAGYVERLGIPTISKATWSSKIQYVMFPLIQPCINFLEVAEKTWQASLFLNRNCNVIRKCVLCRHPQTCGTTFKMG